MVDKGKYTGVHFEGWSLVKMGTTSLQKVIFNLKKIKNKIGAFEDGDLLPENVENIANQLNVDQEKYL